MFGNSKLDYERDILWKKLLLGKPALAKAGLSLNEWSYLSEFVVKRNLKQYVFSSFLFVCVLFVCLFFL